MSDFLLSAIGAMGRACWQGGAAVLAAWLALRLARRWAGSEARSWAWRLAPLKFVLALAPLPPLLVPLLPSRPAGPRSVPSVPEAARRTRQAAHEVQGVPVARRERREARAQVLAAAGQALPVPRSASARRSQAPAARAISARLPQAPAAPAREQDAPVQPSQVLADPVRESIGAARSQVLEAPGAPLWALALAALWACGASASVARLAVGIARANRIRARGREVQSERAQTLMSELCGSIGARRAPRLLEVDGGRPLLVGVMRPTIVLPRALLEAGHAELRLILAHELAHHKRHDLAWNFALALIGVLFFFHPLLWLARRESLLAQEMACDEAALRATGEAPATYGKVLLSVAAGAEAATLAGAVGVVNGRSTLLQRIAALANAPASARRVRTAVAVAALGAATPLLPWRAVEPLRAQVVQPDTAQPDASQAARPAAVPGLEDANPPFEDVQVQIVSPRGEAVRGARAFWWKSWLAPVKEQWEELPVDEGGRFVFPASRVKLRNGAPIHTRLVLDAPGWGFTLADLTPPRHLSTRQIRLREASTLRIRVLGESGKPLANKRVIVGQFAPQKRDWIQMPRQVLARFQGQRRTDAGGNCEIAGLPRGFRVEVEVEDARYRFSIEREKNEIELRAPMQQLVIRATVPGTIAGRVFLAATGRGVAGARVGARRLADSDRGVLSSLTGEDGSYTWTQMAPGEYLMWAWPRGTSPEVWQRSGWSSRGTRVTIGAGQTKRLDFALAADATIEGRVLSPSGEPLRGQRLGLLDPSGVARSTQSDAQGRFRFSAIAGPQRVWLEASGLSPRREFDFAVASGRKYLLPLRLEAPIGRESSGQVVGPDGAPVEGVGILLEGLGGTLPRVAFYSDEGGRFVIAGKYLRRPVQLWARRNTLAMARPMLVVAGESGVVLRLRKNGLANFSLRVLDRASGEPIAGARVTLHYSPNPTGSGIGSIEPARRADGQGRLTFAARRADGLYQLDVEAEGFRGQSQNSPTLRPGDNREFVVRLTSLRSTIAGRVIGEDGRPAAGYRVNVAGASNVAIMVSAPDAAKPVTDRAGRFTQSGVGVEGRSVAATVYDPRRRVQWWTTLNVGARGEGIIRLARASRRDVLIRRWDTWRARYNARVRAELIKPGTPAPPIAASVWVNSPPLSLSSLRGRVVILEFWNAGRVSTLQRRQLHDLALRLEPRGVSIIGIAQPLSAVAAMRARLKTNHPEESPEQIEARIIEWRSGTNVKRVAEERGLLYPIAIDAPTSASAPSMWPQGVTRERYGFPAAALVVIDRAGRVAYAGDSLPETLRVLLAALESSGGR